MYTFWKSGTFIENLRYHLYDCYGCHLKKLNNVLVWTICIKIVQIINEGILKVENCWNTHLAKSGTI